MKRIPLLTPLALLVLICPAVWGQDFLRMPDSLQVRWRCSTAAGSGWNQAGYNASGWTKPVFGIPGRYPQWAAPEDQTLHLFMWHPRGANTGRPVYFRRNVYLPGQVTEATVNVCADDQFMLYVNGRSLMQSQAAHQDRSIDLTGQLQPGANVIAVQAKDVQPPGYGLLVTPMITQAFRMDDGSWQYSANGRTGWQKAAADKTAPIKVEGIERGFSCLTAPGGMKDFSTAYFRRTIQLDGLPLEAPTVILGDDSYELKINGKLVTLEKRLERAWMPRKVDIAPFLRPGANTVMVKVTNDWGPGRFYCVPEVTMTF
ncbi:MAG: hypothetical protein ABFE08_00865 [Armatimonadia bacterium]